MSEYAKRPPGAHRKEVDPTQPVPADQLSAGDQGEPAPEHLEG